MGNALKEAGALATVEGGAELAGNVIPDQFIFRAGDIFGGGSTDCECEQ